MSPRRPLLVGLALAVGSTAPACSLFVPNSMRARGDAPFSLGKVESALWMEDRWSDPDEGWGSGTLLLLDEGLDCDEFEDALRGETEDEDSFLAEASGVVAELAWLMPEEDAGFEGTYYSGWYPYYSYAWYEDPSHAVRVFQSAVFSEGTIWQDDYETGRLEVKTLDDELQGSLKTDWIAARFAAEDCGKIPDLETSPADDTGGYHGDDTGW